MTRGIVGGEPPTFRKVVTMQLFEAQSWSATIMKDRYSFTTPCRVLPLSRNVETISCAAAMAGLGTSGRLALLPCGIVVEGSDGLSASLLIAQSDYFSNCHACHSWLRCSKSALRGFQQFTQFFEKDYSFKPPLRRRASRCHSQHRGWSPERSWLRKWSQL